MMRRIISAALTLLLFVSSAACADAPDMPEIQITEESAEAAEAPAEEAIPAPEASAVPETNAGVCAAMPDSGDVPGPSIAVPENELPSDGMTAEVSEPLAEAGPEEACPGTDETVSEGDDTTLDSGEADPESEKSPSAGKETTPEAGESLTEGEETALEGEEGLSESEELTPEELYYDPTAVTDPESGEAESLEGGDADEFEDPAEGSSVEDLPEADPEPDEEIELLIEEASVGEFILTADMILTGYTGTASEITIPDGTVAIASGVFADMPALLLVHIPDSVIDIAGDAFTGSDNVTIDACADSCAVSYAIAYDIPFTVSDFDGVIAGASITIADCLSVNYYVTMSDAYAGLAVMRFTDSERTALVKGYRAAQNTWCFTYTGISADMMTENICAELLYGQNRILIDTIPQYSILTYARNTYSSTSDANLKRLLADMLFYGAAAQDVTGCNSSSPADAPSWVASRKTSTFTNPVSDSCMFGPGGSAKISGAGISIENNVKIRFEFIASDPSGITVDLYRGGMLIRSCALSELAGGSGYSLKTEGISACDLDTVYTAVLRTSDGIIQGCSFSVRSYVHSVSGGSDAVSALVRAMYNYGRSAASYTGAASAARVSALALTGSNSLTLTGDTTFSTLACTVSPAAAMQNVLWYSSDTSVATVTSSGLVQAVGPGECVIYAYSLDGSGVYASMTMYVYESRTYGIFVYTVSDGRVTITGLSSAAGSTISFPTTIDGLPVAAIDPEGFVYCENGLNVTSVSVPDSIELPDMFFIMNDCLYAYTGDGPSATVPYGITSIANYAFKNNTGIETILLPEGLERIGTEAFYGCTKLDVVRPYEQ